MHRIPVICSLALAGVLCVIGTEATAQDLVLKEVSTLRVGACDIQVRFQMELTDGAADALDYRIGVYAPARDNKLLTTLDVAGHKRGATLYFAVPSSALLCDDQVLIRVDDQNRVGTVTKVNGIATVKIDRPKKGGLADPCAVLPGTCQ